MCITQSILDCQNTTWRRISYANVMSYHFLQIHFSFLLNKASVYLKSCTAYLNKVKLLLLKTLQQMFIHIFFTLSKVKSLACVCEFCLYKITGIWPAD